VKELLETRFKGALAAFLGGSAGQGKEGPTSDLDLVVVRMAPRQRRRVGFHFKGWPVDALVIDPQSLENQMKLATKRGQCTLPYLILNSAVFPATWDLTENLRKKARQVIEAGPAPLGKGEIDEIRYSLTYVLEKLKTPRPPEDVLSLGSSLFIRLCHFYLRANGKWGATPTFLPVRMRDEVPELNRKMHEAFMSLYNGKGLGPVQKIVEEIFAPFGGLHDGNYSAVYTVPEGHPMFKSGNENGPRG
jgi:hypothetical protein